MSLNELTIIKELKIPEAIITLKSDGIVYVYINSYVEVGLELQSRMFDHYTEITEGKLMPFFFQAGEAVSVTKEARDNALKIEKSSPCKAMAVLVDNIAYRLIANFYLKVNKPKRPYRVFDKKEEAIGWLKTFA